MLYKVVLTFETLDDLTIGEIFILNFILQLFASRALHVFQAVDIDLRKRYQPVTCDPHLNEADYNKCLTFKAEGMASRSQLALLLFEMEQKNQGNGATEVHELR